MQIERRVLAKEGTIVKRLEAVESGFQGGVFGKFK